MSQRTGPVSGAAAGILAVLLAVLASAPARPAAAGPPIRVSLGNGLRAVEVGVPEFVAVQDPEGRALFGVRGVRGLLVAPAGRGLEIRWGSGDRDRRGVAMDGVRLRSPGRTLKVGPREYAGLLEVWREGEGLRLVNEVGLEEYVGGTVRAEMPESWPGEALRAMAVIARTYAAFHQQRAAGRPYHLVAGSQDQNFVGHVPPGSPALDATLATAGQVLTWQGAVFPAFYHSDSGGFTEPLQTVFSGPGIPPLPGVRDEFSVDSPHATWRVTLPLATIGERLRRLGHDVGVVTGVTVLERSASLRAAWVAVEHAQGPPARVKGTEFRRALGYNVLKSTLFVPVVRPDGSVQFEGRGWGHGAGLSQFGAKGMAERGYAYRQILEYYYPGAVLTTLP